MYEILTTSSEANAFGHVITEPATVYPLAGKPLKKTMGVPIGVWARVVVVPVLPVYVS
jgi:hypothetical protein